MEKKSYKSWTITDAFWEVVKDEIPERQRAAGKTYKRKPGGGRKALSKRRVLEGIFYVLQTGCQWKAVPKEYGAASNIFKNGQRQDFLKEYGPRVWKNMMSWKGSAGNGKVWMAAW